MYQHYMYIVCTAHKTSRISDIKKKRKNKTNYALQLVRYKRIGDMKSWEKKKKMQGIRTLEGSADR